MLAMEALAFIAVATLVSGPFSSEVRADSVERGRLALLRAFDPTRSRAFDYARMAKLTPSAWLASAKLVTDFDPLRPVDEQGRLTGRVSLPPGEFEAAVWFKGRQSRGGDLLIAFGEGQVLARAIGPLDSPSILRFRMPIEIPEIWIQLTAPSTAQAATRLEMTPLAVVPLSQRLRVQTRAVEAIAGPPNAYMVYANEWTFPEGGVFWTRGTGTGTVYVAPAGSRQLTLTLHVGPSAGTVRLQVENTTTDLAMESEETRIVRLPVAAGAEFVRVAVHSSSAFRPAEREPNSSDTRLLGCQVRIEAK